MANDGGGVIGSDRNYGRFMTLLRCPVKYFVCVEAGSVTSCRGGQSMFSQILIVSQMTTPLQQPLH